jgi:hypothetical protein
VTQKQLGPRRAGSGRAPGGFEDSGEASSSPGLEQNPSGCPARFYHEEAWRRWPDAHWIYNDGPFAVISTCSAHVRITLHPTMARAKEVKAVIDKCYCLRGAGECHCDPEKHVIVDLRKPPKSEAE